MGIVNYFANGSRSYPKERLEVFANNKVFVLENFLSLKSYGLRSDFQKKKLYQDKGHYNCVKSFINAIESSNISPIPISEIFEVQRFLLKLKDND